MEDAGAKKLAQSNGEANGAQDIAIRTYKPDTLAIHADDRLNQTTDVAPAIHVSTTYRYDNTDLNPKHDEELDPLSAPPVYSRLSSPNTTRIEAILSSLLKGHALTYTSGLSAFHAMLVFLRPNRIVIGDGYHGCHGVINICTKLWGLKKISLAADEATWGEEGLGKGDIIHVETPLNPTGLASDLTHYRTLADKYDCYLTVDSTFAPPPLQNPFEQGVDMVMHSGTKYFGGHSDMLCGVLAVAEKHKEWVRGLWNERMYLGSVMGSMELWLGVRSLRTLELRVLRQSENATKLVAWIAAELQRDGSAARKTVQKVEHASLQKDDMHWLKKQMPGGFGPVFALWMKNRDCAKGLPPKLHLFHHATSLGGVESLVEWRKMSDQTVDERVIRVSVGIENWEDLREDFAQAFEALAL